MRLAVPERFCRCVQLRAKCPSCPQLKQALLVFLGGLLLRWVVWNALPRLGGPPHLQGGARAQSRSIGTAWLFIHLGAFEEVNWEFPWGLCGVLLEKKGCFHPWKVFRKFWKARPWNPPLLGLWKFPVLPP